MDPVYRPEDGTHRRAELGTHLALAISDASLRQLSPGFAATVLDRTGMLTRTFEMVS